MSTTERPPGVDTHWSSGRQAEGSVPSGKLVPDAVRRRIQSNPRRWVRPDETGIEEETDDTGGQVKEVLEK